MEQDTTSGVNSGADTTSGVSCGAGYYIRCQYWSRILHRVSIVEQDTTFSSGAHEFSPVFVRFMLSIFSFLCSV
jgi:hypothetical protein